MGEALVSGLLGAGWDPADVALCVRRADRAEELAARTGCRVSLDSPRASPAAIVVVVAVKPRDVALVVKALDGVVEDAQVIISLAAGVTTQTYESVLGTVPVVRAMPNTPALVREGVTGIAAGNHAGVDQLEVAP